jgi:tetratricopeptide (TPR) repeat protein
VNSPGSGSEPDAVTVPVIWENVPQRNMSFTGREDLFAELMRHVSARPIVLVPHALYGLGGVGKSQLAAEYAYRQASQYQVVCWIPADNLALARSSLAALAPRLGITGLAPGRVEEAVSAVRDALRRGQPYERWLVIFDNADAPDSIRSVMPFGPGDVIVTSRDDSWAQVADALEVDVFNREESARFLAGRVPGISGEDAHRLAEIFGDLPLGLDQAAAWLTQTAMTVDTYLGLLEQKGSRVLAESPGPADYPVPVAAAWSLSVARLQSQAPDAMELLRICVFFGPAPISLELLDRACLAPESPLQRILNAPAALHLAIRALGRYALARVDSYRRTLEVHRVIQRLIRDELDTDSSLRLKHEVHVLLAAADPGDPDDIANWQQYADLLAHVGPSEIVGCRAPDVRRLARNIVRYLYVTGNYGSALTSADKALVRWSEDSGAEDPSVLIMTRLKIQVLQALAQYREAYNLTITTLGRMSSVLGEDHAETLNLVNCHCIDLWARGEYANSLTFTKDSLARHSRVFGDDHPRTFAAMNNYAEDLELDGSYAEASELHRQLYRAKAEVYGNDRHPRALYTLGALGRTTLAEGRYAEAREIAERAHEGFRGLVRDHVLADSHPWVLQQAVDRAMARRAAGAYTEALALAEEAHSRCRRAYLGDDHPRTLAAAVSLGNAQLLAGDIQSAGRLLENTSRRYRGLFGAEHPYALGCSVNVAIIRRHLGKVDQAREILEAGATGLGLRLGPRHHHSLLCQVNLATALADAGEVARAAQLGESALRDLASLLGEDHPHSLACAANLALDLRAAGQEDRIPELAPDMTERYGRALGHDHPVARAAAAGKRVDLWVDLHATF